MGLRFNFLMPLKYYLLIYPHTVCGYRKRQNILRENSDNKYVQICNTTAKYNPVSFKIGFPVFILAAQIK